jgi:acid stress-induced BolA-like protein IbaG/YrbA
MMNAQQADTAGITGQIRQAILAELPGAEVAVSGGGGHFSIDVVAEAFAGKSVVDQQRMVYRAIKHLMAGANAPVHAVDRMTTRLPQ